MPGDRDGSNDPNDERDVDDPNYGDTDTERDGPTNGEIAEQDQEDAEDRYREDHPDEEDLPPDLSDVDGVNYYDP